MYLICDMWSIILFQKSTIKSPNSACVVLILNAPPTANVNSFFVAFIDCLEEQFYMS